MASFLRSCYLLSKAAAPFYIPTSSVQGFQLLYLLFRTIIAHVFIIAILVGVE
jgi:hypothetical protein